MNPQITQHGEWTITISEIPNVDGPHWKVLATTGHRGFTDYYPCASVPPAQAVAKTVERCDYADSPRAEQDRITRAFQWRQEDSRKTLRRTRLGYPLPEFGIHRQRSYATL